jgi:peptidoglycan/xylan/chitin deacetylase (PgdA/CDA1 family)
MSIMRSSSSIKILSLFFLFILSLFPITADQQKTYSKDLSQPGTPAGSKNENYQPASVFILCFHTFLGISGSNSAMDFSLPETRKIISEFQANGFTFVQFSDIVSGNIKGTKNILISIDDGNHSVYEAYKLVFKPLGIKPLFAIYPAIISRQKYALTWDQLKEFRKDGCEIGVHGYYHLFITDKLYATDKSAFMKEIYTSKQEMEKGLGEPVDLFVYPFGAYSPVTVENLTKAGYTYAFSLVQPSMTLSSPPAKEYTYYLPRFLMTKSKTKAIIAELEGKADKPQAAAAVIPPFKENDPSVRAKSVPAALPNAKPSPTPNPRDLIPQGYLD